MTPTDVVALILGLILLFLITCAGLGWFSRRRQAVK
jgi:hypothetical protein